MKDRTHGWAIETNAGFPSPFLGKSYLMTVVPRHMNGYEVAVWPTRAGARWFLRGMKSRRHVPFPFPFPKARVVKVRVTVEASDGR